MRCRSRSQVRSTGALVNPTSFRSIDNERQSVFMKPNDKLKFVEQAMPIVEIENLTKDYEVGFWRKRKVRALDGLSLSVNQGEIFGFLGANGAGKTTTLKLLMRLIFPTSGNARILGHDIADISMHSRIGYLPENPYFYDYLTAREFLEYCAELFGYRLGVRRRLATELLARVRLDDKSW